MQGKSLIIALAILLAAWVSPAPARRSAETRLTVTDNETLHQSYPLSGKGAPSLDIDMVWGYIHVTAARTNTVEVAVHKQIRAESQTALEAAKQDVTLDVTRQNDAVRLYVNGPFRCDHERDQPRNSECNAGHRPIAHYVVQYDFEVTVPRETALRLRTVLDGDVQVHGVAGDFSVHNVNGSIDMEDIAGSGVAQTVNGHVKVSFRRNPTVDSRFATINGPIELYFTPSLSADLRFKTMNGAVYTDYEMAALPPREPEVSRRGGKYLYRADDFTGGRVGSGGPAIKIENFNGDIHVLTRPLL